MVSSSLGLIEDEAAVKFLRTDVLSIARNLADLIPSRMHGKVTACRPPLCTSPPEEVVERHRADDDIPLIIERSKSSSSRRCRCMPATKRLALAWLVNDRPL
jgi:hypothetical protein